MIYDSLAYPEQAQSAIESWLRSARCRQVRVASVSGVGWKRRLACRDRGESDVVARGGRRVDALALHQYEAVACGGSKEAPKRGVGAAVGQAA